MQTITNNSKQAKEGITFFAISGGASDGHNYIKQALEQGCTSVVGEYWPTDLEKGNCEFQQVADSRIAWALACHQEYNFPAKGMKLVGVTGTNGKTTTVHVIFELWKKMGISCGMISTIENRIGISGVDDEVFETSHTTPDPSELVTFFAKCKDKGVTHIAMEASSHAIAQHRIDGLIFDVAVFTNLTQDHLDFHKTMQEYGATKQKLFSEYLTSDSTAIINSDDSWAEFMVEKTPAKVVRFNRETLSFDSMLVGDFNHANSTGALLAVSVLDNKKVEELFSLVATITAPKGRMELVHKDNPMVIVDFAHTPDGLENLLSTVKKIATEKSKKLVCIFGCGGDRDKGKRPQMAAISEKYCDSVIVTSDNPRTENPESVLDDVVAGFSDSFEYKREVDRKEAIKFALSTFADSIIVIAGKGHEQYQIIGTEKKHYSDQEEVLSYFN